MLPEIPSVGGCSGPLSVRYHIMPNDPALFDDQNACILDCPRTDQVSDYGNPISSESARSVKQQRDRAATFVFRNTQSLTVTFMTSVGFEMMRVMDEVD